ncbi:MAG: 2-succinyl-5-enolpyruvyl-6-hydroxy-3-cyclohexene-carboxylate synthase [Actinomycetota bacterium]|nr:2-succinyl-5-enolpyruvyl-6-hydroxy-3-cyclohexene-carboxylate synthase [Actinomycetota bacterium]
MNPATALARATVQALADAEVSWAVLCPGSRSAPLAYELHRRDPGAGPSRPPCPPEPGLRGSGPRLCVRHDERVAGFVALGVGKAGTGLGAVVTTSGTAVANLHPAVLEAHHSNVPLVVITADRPEQLRGTWANQTTDLQSGLFGTAVRACLDLGDVAAQSDPARTRQALARVLLAARGPEGARPGPVHLNLGFSLPLVPDDQDPAGETPVGETAVGETPVSGVPAAGGPPTGQAGALPGQAGPLFRAAADGPAARLLADLGSRTVVVAGDGAGPWAALLAERYGLPLLAEPSSGSRTGPNAVGPYRLLLEMPELGGRIERALVLGRPTLSRPVTRLLEDPAVEVILVTEHPAWPEPGREVLRIPRVHLLPLPDRPLTDRPLPDRPLPDRPEADRPEADRPEILAADAWLRAWIRSGAAAADAVDAVLDGEKRLTGPLVAREVAAATPPGRRLMVSASNPVRDLDLVLRPSDAHSAPVIRANRGLAGIDGVLSTACGLALAPGARPGEPVGVLVGDLAFLHDLNALLTGPCEQAPDVRIVVLNDGGGGIFSLLEHGERALRSPDRAAAFERLFGTPQTADLGALCAGYGVAHRSVTDLADLRRALREPVGGISVVEVRTYRSDLRDLHRRIREEVTDRARPH